MRTNCHIPIAVRMVGEPTPAQLEALGHLLARTVAARLAHAERVLAERHHGDTGIASAQWEPYEPGQGAAAAFAVPAHGAEGAPADVPVRLAVRTSAGPPTTRTPAAVKAVGAEPPPAKAPPTAGNAGGEPPVGAAPDTTPTAPESAGGQPPAATPPVGTRPGARTTGTQSPTAAAPPTAPATGAAPPATKTPAKAPARGPKGATGAAGAQPPTPKPPRLQDLRRRARTDASAAHELVDRYRSMSDRELARRLADGDETARAVMRQRIPSNDSARAKALESDYRPPHHATASVRRAGVEVWRRTDLVSGNMTSEEAALPFPHNVNATHTEARAVREADLRPGDVMTIIGQYNPCSACREVMLRAAGRTRATIKYIWMGGTRTFRPIRGTAMPGTPTAAVTDAVLETPVVPRPTSERTPAESPGPGPVPGTPSASGATEGVGPVGAGSVRPTAPRPPEVMSRYSGGQRAVAGAALAIAAVNDILTYVNLARGAAQHNIDLGNAELAFWTWAGAKPTRGVRDSWKGPLPPGSEPDVSTFGSSSWPYVADIDVDALRRNLPGVIHGYQDFLHFMDTARELGAIVEYPEIPDRPNALQRAQAEHVRYYAEVSKDDRGKRHRYDLTEVIAPIRDAALAALDAGMRARTSTLSAGQRHQIFRLRRGAGTVIYRAAHKGGRLEQRILNSQRLFGPDPWVRAVGPDTDVGGWFGTDIRVRVTPANADAQRVALAAAYWVGGDIHDVFDEVREAGRPIVDRQPEEGRFVDVLDSFVAGPKPGDPRFGNTRYHRHPDPDVGLTAAIGELNEFWVERDDLVQVPAADLGRYIQ
ncbi:hypothetical protein [Streptomyces sp. AK08-02]|uniref:hypothetical protein n=1 Tax=Streptomyces sp. AK08-02 TaxID=3028654 RepID=UPI0029BF99C6|nr:hypothetical protein [Streptomyces sp. AK08-02]MDX3748931.1 hypothetical protein [Streptomyces sp. AK08-02]